MDRVLIAYRYSASFRIAYDEEDQRWSRRIGENRLVLLYDNIESRYYVLQGKIGVSGPSLTQQERLYSREVFDAVDRIDTV